MSRTSLAAKTLLAAVALSALGLASAMPASAHTNNMYGFIYEGPGLSAETFGTWSKTDGTIAPLSESLTFLTEPQGIEVHAEKGYAVGFTVNGPAVWEWNHSTGAAGVPVAMFISGSELQSISGLDVQLDGTVLTLAQYFTAPSEGPIVESYAVAKVNVGTGEVTPVVDITDLLSSESATEYQAIDLATDSLGGGTFVFLQNAAFESFFLSIDVAAGSHGSPTLFQGTGFDVEGFIYGADFDGDGSLYFIFDNYESDEEFQLSKTTGVATWVTAPRTVISGVPANPDYQVSKRALAIEWAALANTGSELPVAAIVLVGSVAVLAGGLTVVAARRRAERGTL